MAVQWGRRTQKSSRRQSAPPPSDVAYKAVSQNGSSTGYPYASLLYPEPSFLRGVGAAFDLFPSGALVNFNGSLTPWQADYLALLSDHRAIAADWKAVLSRRKRAS